ALGREVRLYAASADFLGHADAVVLDFQDGAVALAAGPQANDALPAGGGDQGLAQLRVCRRWNRATVPAPRWRAAERLLVFLIPDPCSLTPFPCLLAQVI